MGLAYELIQVTMVMTQKPEYHQIHPHGKAPVLVDGDVTIFESAAICAYLVDKYPEKGFAPLPLTSARGYYYQWLFYSPLTLEPPVEQFMFHVEYYMATVVKCSIKILQPIIIKIAPPSISICF